MTAFFSWYILLTILGWITFPLVYRLFPALSDRGFTLARTAGLLLWGYAFWIFTSLGISQNDMGGILLALVVLVGLSTWAFLTADHRPRTTEQNVVHRPLSIVNWIKENRRLIITTEVLFLLSFVILALLRAANPEIVGTEKPMELAFINAILRSPTFPPHDPWLSGYAISYYHFGYILTSMLAMITSTPGTMAFNLMLALVFALAAVGAYGILYNLLALTTDHRQQTTEGVVVHRPSSVVPLLGPLFLLILSNIEGFLELIHRYGFFWSNGESPFWTWLNVKDLTLPPAQPYVWTPESVRYLWWWRASRVVQDYDLAGNWQEIIDEFPFFSFLLGDLHPHVLAIPFGLLAISVALHLFLGASRGSMDLFGLKLHISPLDFTFTALVLGGLAFLNTWDILVGAALIVFSYILFRVREDGWRWSRFEDLFVFAIPLAISAILMYLPFYIGFASQAGGIVPNLTSPTRGAHLWIMFAPMFVPIFAYVFWRGDKSRPNWKFALWAVLGLAILLWAVSWLGALAFRFRDPVFAAEYLQSQRVDTLAAFFTAASLRRLGSIGSLLTLLAILIPAVAYLTGNHQQPETETIESEIVTHHSPLVARPFVLLLILLGALLVLGPEFLYLRDQFGWRMNTIFKFYYQAWMLWSIAASFGTVVLLQNLRGLGGGIFRVLLAAILIMGLTYPILSTATKTNNFQPYFGYTLDDFDRVRRENPDEADALEWLRSAPEGVVAEAIGDSYTAYARVSTYSGMPTVLGWPGHEGQWRGGYEEQGSRNEDIILLYSTTDWNLASEIIQKYDIRYIYIGTLEHGTMAVQEAKFHTHLRVAYQNSSVVIFEVP